MSKTTSLRPRAVMVATAAVASLAGLWLVTTGLGGDRRSGGVAQPGPTVAAVPVWYDGKGLHRGNVVEETPVDLLVPEQVVGPNEVKPAKGALALVRSGAVYLNPATYEVWFHPWGGAPRIVGRHSAAGPGGDPNGDTAAWFDGGQLVVYNTATGREISRTLQSHDAGATDGEHRPAGNSFLQVSAQRVVWTSRAQTYSHDVRTRTTSVGQFEDVHGQVKVSFDSNAVVLRLPGRVEERHPGLEPTFARLSATGSHLLAVEKTPGRHGAVILDTRTGALWRMPNEAYPWLAWSYGDMAMVDTEENLLACDIARRACDHLPAERPFLMPTN
jgi:hypothetical protein